MAKKYLMAGILLIVILLSGCTRPYQGSAVAITPSPAGAFEDEGYLTMEAIKTKAAAQSQGTADPAQLTVVALTVTASGGTAITPQTLITFTPTPIIGGQLTTVPSNTPAVVCTPSACAAGQTLICPSGNCSGGCGMVCAVVTATFTPLPQGATPSSWTLHAGEFPYCIARRFNLNPEYLLSYPGNEWTYGAPYFAGEVLVIPPASDVNRGPFPGTRALRAHPAGTNYTVTGNDDTNLYAVACLFGDVDPNVLAQINGLSLGASLNVGQVIKIQQ